MLHYHEAVSQWSVNAIRSCILGSQGFVYIGALISEQLTTSIAKNATDRRQNTHSKIMIVTNCTTSKRDYWLLNT
jgi:hypothetical protein